MCGICGWVGINQAEREAAPDRLSQMVASIRHRGPDRQGTWMDGPTGLGHARLSILDLSPQGNQPMAAGDGRQVIVFNGEVYNFLELRSRLESLGHQFVSRTDTEVVLAAYREWGTAAFEQFNGIFALAIWDRDAERLVLARDRLGVKPLYYSGQGQQLVFGSEIKAILASRQLEPEIDPAGLQEILWFGGSGLGDNTLFRGIKKLVPGHYLTWSGGQWKERAYWTAEQVGESHASLSENTAQLTELLEAAVRRQLVSDVPVGTFLSGGIDSSAVVAFASRHYSGRLKTFSAGFDFVGDANELPQARAVAEHFGTDHQELIISGGEVPELLEALVWHHDEPFGDAANIPLYLLCQALKGEPKVILQGDGGDEMFGGYRRYALLRHYRFWRSLSLARSLVGKLGGQRGKRLERILNAFGAPNDAERMALLLTLETKSNSPNRILHRDWREQVEGHDPFQRYREIEQRFQSKDRVQKMLWTDGHILLPDDFLEKVDKPTMAQSIEVRVPFLDNEVVEFALGLPSHQKVVGREKKFLLRKALRGIVPDSVLDAPKAGFGVPYGKWVRGPLDGFLKEVLFDSANDSLIDRKAVESAIAENHRRGGAYDFLLWKALNLGLWHRRYCVEKRF